MHVAYKIYCATFISVCQVNKKKIAIFVHILKPRINKKNKNIKKLLRKTKKYYIIDMYIEKSKNRS